MKTIKKMATTLVLLIFCGTIAFAQQGKGEVKKAERPVKAKLVQQGTENVKSVDKQEVKNQAKQAKDKGAEKVKGQKEKIKIDPKDHSDKQLEKVKTKAAKPTKSDTVKAKGHAHGQHKGDLSGKEFGQQRSEEASSMPKALKEEKKQKLDQDLIKQEDKIAAAKAKVEKAKKDLEEKVKNGGIDTGAAAKKQEAIDKATQAIETLEDKVKKGRELMGL